MQYLAKPVCQVDQLELQEQHHQMANTVLESEHLRGVGDLLVASLLVEAAQHQVPWHVRQNMASRVQR